MAKGAAQAATDAEVALAQAQQAAAQVQALAKPALARVPGAQDPATAMAGLQQAAARISTDEQTAQQAGAAGADSAQQVAAVATQVQALLVNRERAAVAAWETVHVAPPGYLGVQYTAPGPQRVAPAAAQSWRPLGRLWRQGWWGVSKRERITSHPPCCPTRSAGLSVRSRAAIRSRRARRAPRRPDTGWRARPRA